MKRKWSGVGVSEPMCFFVSSALTEPEADAAEAGRCSCATYQCLSPKNEANSEDHLFCHLPELPVFIAADHCWGWYYFIPYLPRKQGF